MKMKKIILIVCLLVGIGFTTHAENEAIPIINTIFLKVLKSLPIDFNLVWWGVLPLSFPFALDGDYALLVKRIKCYPNKVF